MSDRKQHSAEEKMLHKVQSDARHRIRGRNKRDTLVFGLGTFGIVGWSVVVPTIVGIAVGVQLDKNSQANFSWTLTLLFAGVILGCFNAWYWVQQKSTEK